MRPNPPVIGAKCIVCETVHAADLTDVIIGKPITCDGCGGRAERNRRGVYGRGPQEWQRKVDAAGVDDDRMTGGCDHCGEIRPVDYEGGIMTCTECKGCEECYGICGSR